MVEPRGSDRGVSEVLSYVFVFSLILFSVGVVSVTGFASLDTVRTAEQVENAEKAFDVLHSNMVELYDEGAPSRATELELGSTELYYGEYVTVDVNLRAGATWENDTSYQIRPIVQRLGDERFVYYESGAVLRENRQSGVVTNDPPILSRGNSVYVTLPVLQAPNVRSVGGSTALVRAEVTDREVVARDTTGTYDEIELNITSPRASVWHDHLEERGFDCTDPAGQNTKCRQDSFERLIVTAHEIDLSLVR
jgi:hypothetical protein